MRNFQLGLYLLHNEMVSWSPSTLVTFIVFFGNRQMSVKNVSAIPDFTVHLFVGKSKGSVVMPKVS